MLGARPAFMVTSDETGQGDTAARAARIPSASCAKAAVNSHDSVTFA
jgi:hypothetical protein